MAAMVVLVLVPLVVAVKVVEAVVPTPMMTLVMVKQEAVAVEAAVVAHNATPATQEILETLETKTLETQEMLPIPILLQIFL